MTTPSLYEHAAPIIRGHLIRAVSAAHDARTQRDRSAKMKEAFGLASALSVMSHSADQSSAPGIIDPLGRIPARGIELTRKYLGPVEADRLGITDTAPASP